jgi:hypothetical protein
MSENDTKKVTVTYCQEQEHKKTRPAQHRNSVQKSRLIKCSILAGRQGAEARAGASRLQVI